MMVGFRPRVIARPATENHLPQTADGLRKGAPLEPHIEVDDASSAAFGIVNPQVLFSVYPKARMTFIPQW